MGIPHAPELKRKLMPPPTGPSLPRAVVLSDAAESDGKILHQLFKLVNAMMRKLCEMSEVVNRAEEKVDRLLEAQDDRRVTDLLEEIINFPIDDKDGLALLEDILTTSDNKVKLVGLFSLFYSPRRRLTFFSSPFFLDSPSQQGRWIRPGRLCTPHPRYNVYRQVRYGDGLGRQKQGKGSHCQFRNLQTNQRYIISPHVFPNCPSNDFIFF